MMLLFSFPVMMATLYGLSRAYFLKIDRTNQEGYVNQHQFCTFRRTVDYVSGVFFSHGSLQFNKPLIGQIKTK
jgi:hypothetical protein